LYRNKLQTSRQSQAPTYSPPASCCSSHSIWFHSPTPAPGWYSWRSWWPRRRILNFTPAPYRIFAGI